MKKFFASLVLVVFALQNASAQSVKVLAECTVNYYIQSSEANGATTDAFKNATKTLYIKGNQSRIDLVSSSFSQSVIFEKSTGNAVILREIGNNKFITKLDNSKWKALNNKYDGAILKDLNETKVILGYECKKAVLELKDGTSLNLFYATGIVPSVKEFEYQFKDVPGFVLEYESQEQNGQKVKYTATKINVSPVLLNKFEIPTSGYRILN